MADLKKKQQFVPADNPLETLKDIGVGVVREASSIPNQILDTAFEQIGLKPQKQPMSGEIQVASGVHKTNEQNPPQTDNRDKSKDVRQLQYVQRNEKEVFNMKQKELQDQIGTLMRNLQAEVAKLKMQTAELTNDVKKVTVETKPAKAGIYHLNFFEQIISMLKELRKTVSESRQWLAASANKKKQKGYWQMFKKHGTNFAMSDERGIATSNG